MIHFLNHPPPGARAGNLKGFLNAPLPLQGDTPEHIKIDGARAGNLKGFLNAPMPLSTTTTPNGKTPPPAFKASTAPASSSMSTSPPPPNYVTTGGNSKSLINPTPEKVPYNFPSMDVTPPPPPPSNRSPPTQLPPMNNPTHSSVPPARSSPSTPSPLQSTPTQSASPSIRQPSPPTMYIPRETSCEIKQSFDAAGNVVLVRKTSGKASSVGLSRPFTSMSPMVNTSNPTPTTTTSSPASTSLPPTSTSKPPSSQSLSPLELALARDRANAKATSGTGTGASMDTIMGKQPTAAGIADVGAMVRDIERDSCLYLSQKDKKQKTDDDNVAPVSPDILYNLRMRNSPATVATRKLPMDNGKFLEKSAAIEREEGLIFKGEKQSEQRTNRDIIQQLEENGDGINAVSFEEGEGKFQPSSILPSYFPKSRVVKKYVREV